MQGARILDRDILFAGLKLPAIDRSRVLSELGNVANEQWLWDDFRATSMLPLMTLDGRSGKSSLINLNTDGENADFIWNDICPPTILNYFEQHIFTWMKPKPRIVILRTPANASNNEHIDCTRSQLGSRQLKFRMVLSGQSSSLYFITASGTISAPEISNPFLIDGSWPHGMKNDSPLDKITICAGAPWSGAEQYPEFHSVISKETLSMPLNLEQYFRK
jgi:hypothetical protein